MGVDFETSGTLNLNSKVSFNKQFSLTMKQTRRARGTAGQSARRKPCFGYPEFIKVEPPKLKPNRSKPRSNRRKAKRPPTGGPRVPVNSCVSQAPAKRYSCFSQAPSIRPSARANGLSMSRRISDRVSSLPSDKAKGQMTDLRASRQRSGSPEKKTCLKKSSRKFIRKSSMAPHAPRRVRFRSKLHVNVYE